MKLRMTTKDYDHLFKLVIIGDSGVGKTSLAFRFADNVFSAMHKATIGLDFKTKTIECDGKKIKLQIWDTGGQERFQSLGLAYYRGADGAILVYDITNTQSFENISGWFSEVNEQALDCAKTMILGNKCDMTENRQVAKDRGETIAMERDSLYYETSAKTGTNVQQAFTDLVKSILNAKDQNQKKDNKAKAKICNLL